MPRCRQAENSLPSVGIPDVDHGIRAFLPCHQPAFVFANTGTGDWVQLQQVIMNKRCRSQPAFVTSDSGTTTSDGVQLQQ